MLFEQDRQDTVPAAFVSYNTGSLPSGGPARPLSVVGAYAEAGVQLQTAGVTDIVAHRRDRRPTATWSDAELHAAMVRHFSLWRDLPQWAVWLFHAQKHDLGPGLLGIMFDQMGRQRQGAAVFYHGPRRRDRRQAAAAALHVHARAGATASTCCTRGRSRWPRRRCRTGPPRSRG